MAKNVNRIPVFIMEEHHEAFYYWNRFISEGLIPQRGNYLLHVDHHDDMESGGYDWDFDRPFDNLEEIREFTYDKLGIADFIIPAVYQGLFSKVHIVKNVTPIPVKEQKRYVKCVKKHELRTGLMVPFIHHDYVGKEDSPYCFYTQLEGGLLPIETEGPVVLDIDLDYFCWDDSLKSVEPKRIEITEEAYEDFRTNPYHPFRILPRKLLKTMRVNGRCYLVYEENLEQDKLPTRDRMKKRMDNLLKWLMESRITPTVIDICRSRYSGYLNKEVFPWVEKEFLEQMENVMKIEVKEVYNRR